MVSPDEKNHHVDRAQTRPFRVNKTHTRVVFCGGNWDIFIVTRYRLCQVPDVVYALEDHAHALRAAIRSDPEG